MRLVHSIIRLSNKIIRACFFDTPAFVQSMALADLTAPTANADRIPLRKNSAQIRTSRCVYGRKSISRIPGME